MKKNINIITVPEETGYANIDEITPERIILARYNKKEGRLRDIDNLFDYLMEYDDNLAGSSDVRIEAVRAREYSLPDITDSRKLQFFQNILKKFYDELIQTTIEGKLYGHLFRQIVWTQENGLFLPQEAIDYKSIDLRIIKRKLELFSNNELMSTDDHRFLKCIYKKSILNSLTKYYLFSSFALNNWAQFTETFGKPLRLGKYSPNANPEDVAVLKQAVEDLGGDQAAVIPESAIIEFIDHVNKSASKDLYESLANFSRNAVTKRILGQTLTTEAVSTGGSYAQSKTHQKVRHDILKGDVRDCEALISDFLTTINKLNFNDDYISIDIDDSEPIDLQERIRIDQALVTSIGLEIDSEYFYETYKVPNPSKKKP